jgi:uncharacterized protein YegL
MTGEKIQSLNFGIKEAIPEMQKVAEANPNAEVLVRAIKFSDGAQWHISQPTEVKDFKWVDLPASGLTCMGKAMEMVADALKVSTVGEQGLPPLLALVSDGQPTDNFAGGLQKLMNEPWGRKAVRVAIAIGDDADLDCLQKFIGHNELKPLLVRNAPALVNAIKWVSTKLLDTISKPASQVKGAASVSTNVPIPQPPSSSPSAADVW